MDNAHLFRHRQGQKGKIVLVEGHICKECGEPATLSRTVNGIVRRTCSIHWVTPDKRLDKATEALLQSLGLVL